MTDKIDQRLAQLADALDNLSDDHSAGLSRSITGSIAKSIRSILPVAGETATEDYKAFNERLHAFVEEMAAESEPTLPQDDGLVERLKAPPTLHNDAPEGYFLISRATIADMLSARTETAARITALKAQVAEVRVILGAWDINSLPNDCSLKQIAEDRIDDLQKIRALNDRQAELIDKYKWQVRDTCSRAEKAEAELTAERKAREQAERSLAFLRQGMDAAASSPQEDHPLRIQLTAARSTIAAQAREIEAIREAAINLNNACAEMWNDVCRITHLDSHTRVIGSAQAQLRTALTEGEESHVR